MWTDGDGHPTDVPEPPASGAFDAIASYQGAAYDRNAFVRGTEQEVDFVVHALGLRAGALVLDVGCGTGRHVLALRRRGIRAVGVDRAHALVAAHGTAARGARADRFVTADATALPFPDGAFDAALSLCQGAFGYADLADRAVLTEVRRTLRQGGSVALSAFSLVYAVRHLRDGESIDASRNLHHHVAEVRDAGASPRRFDLWTRCWTEPELRAAARDAGLVARAVHGVETGSFCAVAVTVDVPELLLVASKP